MATRDLGNPDYEPSDEELRELMHRAFGDVKARHQAAIAALRQDIARRIALGAAPAAGPKAAG